LFNVESSLFRKILEKNTITNQRKFITTGEIYNSLFYSTRRFAFAENLFLFSNLIFTIAFNITILISYGNFETS